MQNQMYRNSDLHRAPQVLQVDKVHFITYDAKSFCCQDGWIIVSMSVDVDIEHGYIWSSVNLNVVQMGI